MLPVGTAMALSTMVVSAGIGSESYLLGKRSFLAEMALRQGQEQHDLEQLLEQARYDPDVLDAMARPYEAKPWPQYRDLFLTPARIQGGIDYWDAQAATLTQAQEAFGVPAEIIVAILGVETHYGAHLGRYRAIDVLTTLGFAYPPRAEFFRRELEQFLLLAQEEGLDAAGVLGSYAGALGKPQFIPSSYRAYAVDFDRDGRRDLWRSNADIVGSVAHYLRRHGWQPGQPIAFRVQLPEGLPADIPVSEKQPTKPVVAAGRLRAAGVSWPLSLADEAPVDLIRLDGEPQEHWLGLNNFYAITRYNHSNLYAMAVYQLADAIRRGRGDD